MGFSCMFMQQLIPQAQVFGGQGSRSRRSRGVPREGVPSAVTQGGDAGRCSGQEAPGAAGRGN